MQSVGYWEAWSLWWSGAKLEDFAMWGLAMVWWARIGKLLQFAGGAAVVLDLVGPERLLRLRRRSRSFSRWLTRREEKIHERVDSAGPINPAWSNRMLLLLAISPGFALLLALIIALSSSDTSLAEGAHHVLERYSDGVSLREIRFAAVVILAFAALLVPIVWSAMIVVSLWAGLLAGKNPGHPLRWLAFVLIVVGFHFDLLAS